jgi:hypothetical protein
MTLRRAVRDGAADSILEPRDHVAEDALDVLRPFTHEHVPHPGVQLQGLVPARRPLMQQLAPKGIRYDVVGAVHDQERQRHLTGGNNHIVR